MKIGFDAKRFFHNQTGLGNYSRTLVHNLARFYPEIEIYLFTTVASTIKEVAFIDDYPQINLVESNSRFKSYWRSKGINKQLAEYDIDIYHGLSHEIPIDKSDYTWKTVVTMHDLIHKVFPNQYKWIDRVIYEKKFNYSCQNADKIIAISESTKDDIIQYYGIAPGRIEVLYQTCSDHFKQKVTVQQFELVKKKYRLPNQYFIFVGSIIERKNLRSIVDAYRLLNEEARLPIVVLGSGKGHLQEMKNRINKYGLTDTFLFKDQSDLADLPSLYYGARALIYPSLYEGFGIPIIEALFQSCPVITSNISSMPEAGGQHVQLIDPNSPPDIAEAMMNILNEKIPFEPRQYKRHLSQFDSEQLTHNLVGIYRSL